MLQVQRAQAIAHQKNQVHHQNDMLDIELDEMGRPKPTGEFDLSKLEITLLDKKETRRGWAEFCFYMVWFTLFLLIVFNIRNIAGVYRMEAALKGQFLPRVSSTQDEWEDAIGNTGDFWSWVKGIENWVQPSNGLFKNFEFDGPLQKDSVVFEPPTTNNGTIKNQQWILLNNLVIGPVRMRQHRVTANGGCSTTDQFTEYMGDYCVPTYTPTTKSSATYGKLGQFEYTQTTNVPSLWGKLATYPSGGFIQDIPLASNWSGTLSNMEANGWIDRQTRAVIINVNLLNPFLNHFTAITMVVEFDYSGFVVSTFNARSYKATLYHTAGDFVRLIVEIVWFIMFIGAIGITIFNFVRDFRKDPTLHHNPLLWFVRPVWHSVDFIAIVFYFSAMAVYFDYLVRIGTQRDLLFEGEKLIENLEFYEESMEGNANSYVQFFNFVAVVIIFSVLKIFKYFNMNHNLAIFGNTLAGAKSDLAGFFAFFFVVFFGFVFMGHLIFGTSVDGFNRIDTSIFTCFNLILGDFDYNALRETNRLLAPLFFVGFILVIVFVLLNMFLAIINEAYMEEYMRIKELGLESAVDSFRLFMAEKKATGFGFNPRHPRRQGPYGPKPKDKDILKKLAARDIDITDVEQVDEILNIAKPFAYSHVRKARQHFNELEEVEPVEDKVDRLELQIKALMSHFGVKEVDGNQEEKDEEKVHHDSRLEDELDRDADSDPDSDDEDEKPSDNTSDEEDSDQEEEKKAKKDKKDKKHKKKSKKEKD